MKKAILVIVAVVATLCAPRANATMEIRLINGSGDTGWITGTNAVTFNGIVGNYSINVSTGISSNGGNPFLDLNSVNQTTVGAAGVLTIETLADGYTVSTPEFTFEVGGTSTLGGPSSFSAYGGNNNNFCTMNSCDLVSTGLLEIGSTLTFGSSPFSGSTGGHGTSANPYSLAIEATLTGVSAGSDSFNAGITPVPEPSSLALMGSGLIGLAGLLRRKLL